MFKKTFTATPFSEGSITEISFDFFFGTAPFHIYPSLSLCKRFLLIISDMFEQIYAASTEAYQQAGQTTTCRMTFEDCGLDG